MVTKSSNVELFTDGACSGNPALGGGELFCAGGTRRESCLAASPLQRIIAWNFWLLSRSLQALKKPCRVAVHTDSQYVQKGMTQWLEGWKKKIFEVKGGSYRPNHDLWRVLDDLAATHDIVWYWVKGHAGHEENERADALARQGVDAVRMRLSSHDD